MSEAPISAELQVPMITYTIKMSLIFLLLCTDVALHLLREYSEVQVFPGCQTMVILSTMGCLFLIASDTFPFRTGLINTCFTKTLRPPFCTIFLYLAVSLLAEFLYRINDEKDVLWKNGYYIILSFCKGLIVAPIYYTLVLNCANTLGQQKFYDEKYWIDLALAEEEN